MDPELAKNTSEVVKVSMKSSRSWLSSKYSPNKVKGNGCT
jgi:hypothetical protein